MTPFKDVPPGSEPPTSGVDQRHTSTQDLKAQASHPTLPSFKLNPAELKVIGKYEIISLIGSNGTGEVFKAFDQQLLEEVALKVLRPEHLSDPRRCAMFRREVRLARNVAHPNVARLFEFGTMGQLAYLTTEYIEGRSLADIIATDPFPTDDQILDLILGLARGLSAAHEAGVVHRDIKPGNVIVSREGRPVLTDVGLSPLREAKESIRSKNAGNALYMAPEQVLSGPVTHACDCYSLGLIAYELATKRLPFQSSEFAQVMVRLQLSTSDPRAHRPEISEGVSSIIRRCLFRDPADRWDSMNELVCAIERLRAPTRIAIPIPRTYGEPAKRPTKKMAVLPIRAISTELADLAEGFGEDLIGELSGCRNLRIALPQESQALGTSLGFSSQEGERLGVDAVVEGTLRRLPMGLRLNIRLLRICDGEILWARRVDCLPTGLLALQGELAKEIAAAACAERVGQSTKPNVANDPWALELLLRARASYQTHDLKDMLDAERAITEALHKAPRDGILLANASLIFVRKWLLQHNPDPEDLARARELAIDAVTGHAELGESHLAMGTVYYFTGQSQLAARSLLAAITKSPGLPEAHELLGSLLVEAGLIDVGLERLRMASCMNPLLRLAIGEQCRVHALLGNAERSDALLAQVKRMRPIPREYWIQAARVALWLGRRDQAQELFREIDTFPPSTSENEEVYFLVRELLAVRFLGHSPSLLVQMLETSARVNQVSPRRLCVVLELLAETYAMGNDREGALDAVARLTELNLSHPLWWKRSPLLKPIRSHIRVKAALARAETNAQSLLEEVWPMSTRFS